MNDNTIAATWETLRTHLEAKTRALNAEVRSYPTPIARCDDQLPKLLDAVGPIAAGDAGDWERAVVAFLQRPDAATDDDIEAALHTRLRAALCLPSEA